MPQSRLSTAIQDGLLVLGAGHVGLMRPPASFDISDLPRGAVSVMHSYAPDVADWQIAGHTVTQDLPPCGTAIVVVPRAKALQPFQRPFLRVPRTARYAPLRRCRNLDYCSEHGACAVSAPWPARRH